MNVDPGHPSVVLAHGAVQMLVYLPDPSTGFYRGPRFDWSGVIGRIECGGHTWFGRWKTAPHDACANDDVTGTAGEFGMGTFNMPAPLGYEEARPGEAFLKIGVGELRRIDVAPYGFSRPYPVVRPAPWNTAQGAGWIEFRQTAGDCRGYAYHYTQRIAISVSQPGFVIRQTLQNTGRRRVAQTHYCHNFTIVDDALMGPNYEVAFPFPVALDNPSDALIAAKGSTLRFLREMAPNEAFFSTLRGFNPVAAHNGVEIRNLTTGAGIRFTGDRPPVRFHLFATARCLCPEPFVDVSLSPGEATEWTTNYELLTEPR